MLYLILWAVGTAATLEGAQDPDAVGETVFVRGEAFVSRLEGTEPRSIQFGNPVYTMDTLETKEGDIKVLFRDKTVLSLAPNSKVLITEHVYDPERGERRSIFDILKGTVRTIVDQTISLKTNDVRLQTPTAVAGIRGTDVGTKVLAKATQFLCFDGQFEAFFRNNPANRILVRAGQFTEIRGPVPGHPGPIPQNLMKQFSADLKPAPLREVMNQPGGGELLSPGPGPAAMQPAAPIGPRGLEADRPPRPPLPPLLPGGVPITPPEAVKAGTSGSVKVPIRFPSGAK